MTKVLALLAVLLLAGAGATIAMLMADKDRAAISGSDTTRQLKQAQEQAAASRAERDKLRGELERVRQQLESAQADMAKAKADAAAAASKVAASATPRGAGGGSGNAKGMAGPLAEMMKNPAMREMAKQQQLAMLDMQYEGLFNRLSLTPEERTNLKQLIGERVGAELDMGMKMMDGSLTAPQRQALLSDMKQTVEATDAKIRTFMNNDDDFATYKQWEDSKGERMSVNMGKGAFSSAGEPLSPAQEDQLVGAFQAARKAPSPIPDLSRPGNFDPSKMTSADLDRQLQRQDAIAQQVRAAAAGFLTPVQLKALEAMLQQQRAMTEAGLKMTRTMLGGQAPK